MELILVSQCGVSDSFWCVKEIRGFLYQLVCTNSNAKLRSDRTTLRSVFSFLTSWVVIQGGCMLQASWWSLNSCILHWCIHVPIFRANLVIRPANTTKICCLHYQAETMTGNLTGLNIPGIWTSSATHQLLHPILFCQATRKSVLRIRRTDGYLVPCNKNRAWMYPGCRDLNESW